MTYSYGAHSIAQRATLHPHLQQLLDRLLERHDFRIEEGARTRERQQELYDTPPIGTLTQKRGNEEYPHRIRPDGTGWAVDIYPYINGKRIDVRKVGFTPIETAQFAWFLGILRGLAFDYFQGLHAMTNERWDLRFGINWNRDAVILADQSFHDWPHIELERVA